MKRGEVWWAALDPTMGSEIRKTRPCLIVAPDVMVQSLRTVIVVPLTTKGRAISFRPPISFRKTSGLVLLDQVRTLDKRRLLRRMGEVDRDTLTQVLKMLRWIFTE